MPLSLMALLLGGAAAVGLAGGGGSSGGGSSSGDGTDLLPNSDPDDDGAFDGGSGGPFVSPDGGSSSAGEETAAEWAGLSAEEQLIVELINRARLDPTSEVDRLSEPLASGISSDPAQPLAVTGALSDASRAHSQDMDDRDFFDHTNLDGQSPADRAIEEGHGSSFVGENIGWIGSTWTGFDRQDRVDSHHENLWESDGHQRNLMDDRWSEIGVGYDEGSYLGYDGSSFVTEMFGDRGATYLTGVVIEDFDGDDFYDIGEGQGGVRVTADDGSTLYETETWDAGGYTLALPSGTYEVSFAGGDLDSSVSLFVTILDENVKVDVIEDGGATVAMTSAFGGGAETTVGAEAPFLPEVPIEYDLADAEDETDEIMLELI